MFSSFKIIFDEFSKNYLFVSESYLLASNMKKKILINGLKIGREIKKKPKTNWIFHTTD